MGLFEAENEIYRSYKAEGGCNVIPLHLHVKRHYREDNKHHQRDHLLQNLQLHERERTTIAFKTNPVGRHLQAVLEERNAP